MKKWTNASAGKIQCNRFNEAWNKLNWEHNTYVELTGIIGQTERRAVLASMGGLKKREDVTAAQEAIGERFAWTVTAQNVNEIIKAVNAATETAQENRPVHDERETPEAEAERRDKLERTIAEQQAKGEESRRMFVKHYGNGETVTVQPGQMAVVAKVCYDNSDMMTDYFDRHASLSQSFALLVVPKQAETERLARRGVAVSELLATLELEWHTEKWSMGHGNYLEGGGFELPAELQGLRECYGSGGRLTHAHWEISFQAAYKDAVTLDAIAGYGKAGPEPSKSTPTVAGVTITENEEKDGIEIRFPSKPDAATLESLKAQGWRWSRFSSCWYTRRSDAARRFAESIGAPAPAAKPQTQPASESKMIADDVLDVLRQADFDSDSVKLNGQLDRDLYLKVNKTLEQAGGKWNRGRKCHVFAQNPREVLNLNDDGGTVKQGALSGAAITRMVENGNASAAVWQLFPTPPELAARMVGEADIRAKHRVLEPSAGTGNLLKAIDAVTEGTPDKVAVEANPALVEMLTHCGCSGLHIHQGDFLQQNGNLGKFDRIVMNPPFERGNDIKHIQHAANFLADGGRLVALCANGPRQREILKPMAEESGGWWEDLPAGSFTESGTNVNVAMLLICNG